MQETTSAASQVPAEPRTSTEQMGIRVTPRLPDFEFGDDIPTLYYDGSIPLTSFWNGFSVAAEFLEVYFIKHGKKMVKELPPSSPLRDELIRFFQQEANHGRTHGGLNKLLRKRGYPVQLGQRYCRDMIGYWEEFGRELGLDSVMAALGATAEQTLGDIGEALFRDRILKKIGMHRSVRGLLEWHFLEEMEHRAVLFDGYQATYGKRRGGYAARVGALFLGFPLFLTMLFSMSYVMMEFEEEGSGKSLKNWRVLLRWVFKDPGFLQINSGTLRMLQPSYHPWKAYPEAAQYLTDLKEEIFREYWEDTEMKDFRDMNPTVAVGGSPHLESVE